MKLTDYISPVEAKETFTPMSMVKAINHKREENLLLDHHPMIISQSYNLDELEFKFTISEAINKFKEYMLGNDPKRYRFLPLPETWQGLQTCHLIINDFPVRAVLSYNNLYGCFVLTLDTIGNSNVSVR